MQFDKQFVLQALPSVEILYDSFPAFPQISIDSRTLIKDEIFLALSGTQFDGHEFLQDALMAGAAGLIIAKSKLSYLKQIDLKILAQKLVLVVPDPNLALINLARAWRAQFTGAVVGITGSVGKTTTKALLSNILQLAKIPYCASLGNQNNRLGLPLSILRMRSTHQVALLEFGISRRDEMAFLAEIARPTIALITTIGHSHMDELGTLGAVAEEKRQIFKYFNERNIGIINGDHVGLAQVGYIHPVIRFGTKTTNQIQARKVKISSAGVVFDLKIYQKKHPKIKLDKPYFGAVFNALAAVSAACLLEVPQHIIVQGLQQPVVIPGRFEFKSIKNSASILIDDCYNAGPESVKAALLGLEQLNSHTKKVLIFGDMHGLGSEAPFWHRQIGRFLRKVTSLERVILVGKLAHLLKKTAPVGMQIDLVDDWVAARKLLKPNLLQASLILVKGSTLGHQVGLAHLVDDLSDPKNKLVGFNKTQNNISASLAKVKIAPAKIPAKIII